MYGRYKGIVVSTANRSYQERACGAYDQQYAATSTSAYVPAAVIDGSSNGKRREAADRANWIMGEDGGGYGWVWEKWWRGQDRHGMMLGM